jgi:rSAM/selenodomain-associated transferase 1
MHTLEGRTLSVRALRKALKRGDTRVKAIHRVLNPAEPAEISYHLCALAVMTKAPRAGQVKTRLVPPLTPKEAAMLNVCFLRDTANAISDAVLITSDSDKKARVIGVYTPIGAEKDYANILPSEFDLIAQRGEDFGERLCFAAEDLFKCGFESICLIDSDSPTVPAKSFAQAVELLCLPGDRIVLGPSDDGGYYLIGLKKRHREVFEGIDWSTKRVFDQTLQRAAEIGVEVKLLPMGYDVDDRATLQRLCSELLGDNSRDGVAPNTRKVLSEIIEREGRDRIWPV